MLSRDPSVLRVLGSLPSQALGALDALLSECPFFQDTDPLAWRGAVNLHFRVEAMVAPSLWRCASQRTPRECRMCFEFMLHAPQEFQSLLNRPLAHFTTKDVWLEPGTMPREARVVLHTLVWVNPQPAFEEPLAVTHLFAGAFQGWGQALEIIRSEAGVDIAHEVLVDHSAMAIAAQVATLVCSLLIWSVGSPPRLRLRSLRMCLMWAFSMSLLGLGRMWLQPRLLAHRGLGRGIKMDWLTPMALRSSLRLPGPALQPPWVFSWNAWMGCLLTPTSPLFWPLFSGRVTGCIIQWCMTMRSLGVAGWLSSCGMMWRWLLCRLPLLSGTLSLLRGLIPPFRLRRPLRSTMPGCWMRPLCSTTPILSSFLRPLRTLRAQYTQQHVLAVSSLLDRGLFASCSPSRVGLRSSPQPRAVWLGATRPIPSLGPSFCTPLVLFMSLRNLSFCRCGTGAFVAQIFRPLGPLIDFAFHPQVPQRASTEGPPTVVGGDVPPDGISVPPVPAREPEDLLPQPDPVALEPPEVTLHFHDPMRREHSRSVPQLVTLRQVIWSLPLPDRLLAS